MYACSAASRLLPPALSDVDVKSRQLRFASGGVALLARRLRWDSALLVSREFSFFSASFVWKSKEDIWDEKWLWTSSCILRTTPPPNHWPLARQRIYFEMPLTVETFRLVLLIVSRKLSNIRHRCHKALQETFQFSRKLFNSPGNFSTPRETFQLPGKLFNSPGNLSTPQESFEPPPPPPRNPPGNFSTP